MKTSLYKRSLLLLAVCLCAVTAGCINGQIPRIDPSGEHLFIPPPAPLYTAPPATAPGVAPVPAPAAPAVAVPAASRASIDVAPANVIAPVGSDVVLVAGICGETGYVNRRHRVEWMLSSAGVGEFVAPGKRPALEALFSGGETPTKVDNLYAVGSTTSRHLLLTRGTPTPTDDLTILPGQSWIAVSSPLEGTSHVTAYAPDVAGWDVRKQTSTIHWVDAQWSFPPPAINPAGTRHTFVTTLTRSTNQAPLVGWRIRYEIVDGPAAGFAPDGAQAVEVATDELGQAGVEIFQPQAASGTNQIAIQVIRPEGWDGGDGSRLVVGSGTTQKTWTSPEIALRTTAPAEAAVGGTIAYRLDVTNPGGLPARGIVVSDQLPPGVTFVESTPQPTRTGTALEWNLGDLSPGGQSTIELRVRADRAGTVNNCATVRSSDGLSSQDCATTTVVESTIEVTVTGPTEAYINDEVTFDIRVTNRGTAPVAGLVLVDRFDDGFAHASSASPIESQLETLAPGSSRSVPVTFRVTRAGRLCQRVEVHADTGIKARAEACLTATAARDVPPTTPRHAISVRKFAPAKQYVGERVEFNIVVTNMGTDELTDIKIFDNYNNSAFEPDNATQGRRIVGADIVWNVDRLPAGESLRFQVQCLCTQRTDRACSRTTVTTAEGARAEDEACVEIAARPGAGPVAGGLTLTIHDLRDPISVGNDTRYEVRIANPTASSDRQVALTVFLPLGLTPLEDGTVGDTRAQIEGQTVRFEPVAEIRAQETLRFSVAARAVTAGEFRVRAEVTSQAMPQPLTREEVTTAFAEP